MKRIGDENEDQRARREARSVADFLNGWGVPDFLMESILITLFDAFDHFGMPHPEGDFDERNLQPLFLKTKLTHLREFEGVTKDEESIVPIGTNVLEFRTSTIVDKGGTAL